VTRRDLLRLAATAPAVLGLNSLAGAVAAPNAAAAAGIAGMIVFLDPGHNGANDASINRQVPTGRGGTKECQTTGTTTGGGFPEHTFNWDVVLQIRGCS
jgi:N-acetylmuramoyl-L-alanine amidase